MSQLFVALICGHISSGSRKILLVGMDMLEKKERKELKVQALFHDCANRSQWLPLLAEVILYIFGIFRRSPHQGILWGHPYPKENRRGSDYFALSGSPKLLFFALLQLHRLSRVLENQVITKLSFFLLQRRPQEGKAEQEDGEESDTDEKCTICLSMLEDGEDVRYDPFPLLGCLSVTSELCFFNNTTVLSRDCPCSCPDKLTWVVSGFRKENSS